MFTYNIDSFRFVFTNRLFRTNSFASFALIFEDFSIIGTGVIAKNSFISHKNNEIMSDIRRKNQLEFTTATKISDEADKLEACEATICLGTHTGASKIGNTCWCCMSKRLCSNDSQVCFKICNE